MVIWTCIASICFFTAMVVEVGGWWWQVWGWREVAALLTVVVDVDVDVM